MSITRLDVVRQQKTKTKDRKPTKHLDRVRETRLTTKQEPEDNEISLMITDNNTVNQVPG